MGQQKTSWSQKSAYSDEDIEGHGMGMGWVG